jgi:hypothetical protein
MKQSNRWVVEGISMSKEDNMYEYTTSGQTNIYTRLGDKTSCTKLQVSGPPMLKELGNILQNATPFKNKKSSKILDAQVQECAKSKSSMWLFNFANEQFVMCGRKLLGFVIPRRIIGKDVVITFSDFKLEKSKAIEEFKKQRSQCKEVPAAETLSDEELYSDVYEKVELKDAWFYSYADSCHLRFLKHNKHCSKHVDALSDDPAKKKVCIFLHGAGNFKEVGPPTNAFDTYWGKIKDFTPQCSERWYIRENTKANGWDSVELQKKYCALALVGQKSDNVVRNKIIFAHSMGNLIFGAALHNGYCKMDLTTSSWYSSQGPFRGSKAAPFLEGVCAVGEKSSLFAKLEKWVGVYAKYCVAGSTLAYPAYSELKDDYCDKNKQICLRDMESISAKMISGSMCGTSAKGLISIYSAPLEILSRLVHYGEQNDGLVPLSSCKMINRSYGKTSESKMYETDTNHADGTCRNGNGFYSAARKPCSWYTNKM